MRPCARAAVVVTALGLVVLPSCGGDAAAPSGGAAATTPGSAGTAPDPTPGTAAVVDGALPPQDLSELASIYDPLLAPLGVHITRAGLVDLDAGGYVLSAEGRHLALYVAPDQPMTDDQYAAQIAPIAAALTTDVFSRYPGLESYDVCQEGPDLDGDPETLPTTKSQFNVERPGLGALAWDDLDLTELLSAIPTNRSIRLMAAIEVRRTPTFTAAQQAADRQGAGGGTTTTAVPGPSKLPTGDATS